MFEKEAESKNESSNRRRFLRRIAGLTAVSALAGLIHARNYIDPAFAGNGSGLIIGQGNDGSSETSLTASPAGDAAFYVENKSSSSNSAAIEAWASASTGSINGVYARSSSISGRAVYGFAGASTGQTYGVYGSSASVSGRGVYGGTSTFTGTNFGVYGESASENGRGACGKATASTGPTYGVIGESDSEGGTGVYGWATRESGSTYGVYGQSDSVSGRGVYGITGSSTGETYGVYGHSNSASGTGVLGSTSSSTGATYGVYGWSRSISGKGVYGLVDASTGETYGIFGESHSLSGISVLGNAGDISAKPIVARGFGGQTANLQEWQNSSRTALSVIDKDGYLGIGTSSPSTALHVKSPSSNPAIRIENEGNHVGQFIYCYSNGNIPFFSGRRARGIMASPSAVQTDDVLMRYGGAGYGTTNFPPGNRAILEFKAAQNWTDTNQGTYITFSTTPNNSASAAERMRITDAGEIIPPTDNTGSIGTASRRWSLVRATTVTSGDLVFENGVRATEEGKDLAFLNSAGDKIAVLDHAGNFHIRGKVLEDLK